MFGKFIHHHPVNYTEDRLRELLSQHGVICFRGMQFSDAVLFHTMSKLGKVQSYLDQQAPVKFTDKEYPYIIHLDNNDWLKGAREGWHTDQTYLESSYLPIRSLYCTSVDANNQTEFADVKWLTDRLLEKFPELENYLGKYYMNADTYTVRNIISQCDHIGRKVLRYDNRTQLQGNFDTSAYKLLCQDLLNSPDIPKFTVKWRPYDFVIFDNNQCPHRRSVTNGNCKLTRLTSYFWLE